jgi:hypothetical protein
MAMVANDFAEDVRDAIGFSGRPVSSEILAFVGAIIDEVKAGTFSHLVVTGTCADGAPLALGEALAGIITGPLGSSLANRIKTGMSQASVTSQLSGLSEAITTNIILGLVNFSAGNVTGSCVGGNLVGGAALGGEVAGISGSLIASAASASLGGTTNALSALCNAIADYIMNASESSYSSGQVIGTYPTPSGGPLVGSASGGVIL